MVSDAALAEASLRGDTAAFGAIVERYKALVCSITYSGTGNLSLSEDLAQETFLTAWRKLDTLEERGKLRAWLCGIARNVTRARMRQERREPVAAAQALETAAGAPSTDETPAQHAISHEAQEVLWRALESIPETYREPMILFYREQQSVRAVAEQLDLSEDAVKQRLSRGRAKLKAEMTAFVEETLGRSGPRGTFTAGVLAALTAGVAPKAAAATAAGAGIAAWSLGGVFGVLNGIAGGFYGALEDYRRAQSDKERRLIVLFTAAFFIYAALWLVSYPVLDHLVGLTAPESVRLPMAWLGAGVGGLGALVGITISRLNRARLEAQGVDVKALRARPVLVGSHWSASPCRSSPRRAVLAVALGLSALAIGIFGWIAIEHRLFEAAAPSFMMLAAAVTVLGCGIIAAAWIGTSPRLTAGGRRFAAVWILVTAGMVSAHLAVRPWLPSGAWTRVEEDVYWVSIIAWTWYGVLRDRNLGRAGGLYTPREASGPPLGVPARISRGRALFQVYGIFAGVTCWMVLMAAMAGDWAVAAALVAAILVVPGAMLRLFGARYWRVVLAAISVAAGLSMVVMNARWHTWMIGYRATRFYEPMIDLPLWVMNLLLGTMFAASIVVCSVKAHRESKAMEHLEGEDTP